MKKIIILLTTIPFLLCLIWFSKGYLIGSGESALPFYYTIKLFHLSMNTWSDGPLGGIVSINILSLLTYGVIAYMERFFNYISIQFLSYYFLLISMSFGIFLVSWKVFRSSLSISFIASSFYLLNLISFSLIWNRLQYPYIFFYAFLPIGFLFFYIGIKKKKLIYSVVTTLLTLVYSFAFVAIPTLELFWLLIGSYLIFYTFIHFRDKQALFFAWKFFIFTLILFLLFNAWWMLQFLYVVFNTSYISQTAYTKSGDISTFTSLSKQLGNLSYLFRLMHIDFFVGKNASWSGFYSNSLIAIISYIIPFLAFIPLLFKKRLKILYFFLALSLLLLFFMKGSQGPFGIVTLFLVTHIRTLEAFRNPVEKLGLALPFAYAPLIGFSLYYLYRISYIKYGKLYSKFIILFLGFLLFVVLVIPLWSGTAFTNNNIGISDYVEIPKYYSQANNWLNMQKSFFRIIALPMSGEGITYTWRHPYSGVELSNNLFDKPFISLSTSAPYIINISSQLENTLFQTPIQFPTLLKFLDVKYVMTRSDIDYKYRGMTNPKEINSFLSSASGKLIPGLSYAKTFGKLVFYKNTNPISKMYTPQNLVLADSSIPFGDIFRLSSITQNSAVVDNNVSADRIKFLELHSQQLFVKPISVLDYSNYPNVSLSDAMRQIYYPRYLPGSLFYPIIRLKEKTHDLFIQDSGTRFFNDLTQTSKRLSELNALLSLNKTSKIPEATAAYIDAINTLNTDIANGGYGVMKNNLYFFRQILIGQKLILDNNMTRYPFAKEQLSNSLQALRKMSTDNGVYPLFTPMNTSGNLIIYRLDIGISGEYALLIHNDNTKNILNDISRIQIDNKLISVAKKEENNWLNLGNEYLTKGIHEIQIPYTNINIFGTETSNIELRSGDKSTQSKSITFNNVNVQSSYSISFDYWIKKGKYVDINFYSNVDQVRNSVDTPFWRTGLLEDSYNHFYETRNITFTPPINARWVTITFTAKPISYGKSRKPTSVLIKNIKIEKVSPQPFYLRLSQDKVTNIPTPMVTFTKINPAEYSIHVTHATQPFFLVFSESFHSLWKLQFIDIKQNVPEKYHFLANSYANMWYIQRTGSYDLKLTFTAEYLYTIGKWISGVAISVSIAALMVIGIRKLKKRIWK